MSVDVLEAIEFLNELIGLDRESIKKLIENRVHCNEKLADHPTVQVQSDDDGDSVGLLGILNGLFGKDKDGWGYITAVFDDDDNLVRFQKTKVKG